MSEPAQLLSLRATLAGRWQIPLLAAGLAIFAAGLAKMARDRRVSSFDEQIALVSRLREGKAHARASAYLADQLKKPGRPAAQRGELARLAASVIHDVESPLAAHNPKNVRAILSNYHTAQRFGIALGAEDWAALAHAYRWSKNRAEAADAYRQALRLPASSPERLRKQLLEVLLDSETGSEDDGPALTPEMLSLLDSLLASENVSPADTYWALQHEVRWWVMERYASKGLSLIEAARGRLAGTEEGLAVSYLEALCQYHSGRPELAEALLRSLRDAWTPHDELWGRTAWLLGRIQQEDDRPQAALAFHDEVLASFRTGPCRDLCQLGRAECLAALERYDESYKDFHALTDRFAPRGKAGTLDRGAVQASAAAIGETLLQVRSLELGVAFLELAVKWTDEPNQTARAYYLTRIAEGLSEMARQAQSPGGEEKPDESKARTLLAKAGEMHLALAEMNSANDSVAARFYENAVADFDAAGLTERMIDVFQRYTARHPEGLWRSTALFKLGQAYQAEHRFGEAITAYEDVIKTYPRMPDAMRSMVPLAECLLVAGSGPAPGGAAMRARGVASLVGIVEDRGKEHLFSPSAAEYREALYRLAEYYTRASDAESPGHLESAVSHWEDWLTLYPDEPRAAKARFMLAEAYRGSGSRLQRESATQAGGDARDRWIVEGQRRLALAGENYDRAIAVWAPRDAAALTDAEATCLRASYLYRADCLFDRGLYAQAIEAYREAAWRYEDDPAALAASLQIVHAHERLGQSPEAVAALARIKWLLAKIPESAFDPDRGNAAKSYWQAMVQRLEESGLY